MARVSKNLKNGKVIITKISTKGRYALRLMLDLALHDKGEFIPLRSVSKRQLISDKYLEQIITQLSRGGFVISARGAQGGYKLAKSPEAYTVGDILRTTEGSLAPVACADEGNTECPRRETCPSRPVWQKLDTLINNYLDGITLEDLLKSP